FGLFSNLSCAQPLSPWWQSQCDGKNLIKLAADSNGAPRWMPDLPADSGVSVRMRLFAPKMILDDIEPGNVGDPCTTDFDCSSENRTACVPRGDLLTPQCSCANLPDQSLSVCNITIDMSVIFINATFEIDPIRGMSSRYVATVRMKHFRGNADIPASSPPKVLANFFTYFLNKSSAVYPPADPIFYFKHNPVTLIQGDLHAGHKLYEEFEFDISTDFVTPKGGQCWSSSYLCIGLLATENETVRDMNPNNNALCLDIDGYKTCQPECDTELLKANLTSLTPNPIERHKNVVVAYNLTVRVNNASFPILELSSDVNFNVTLHFVTSDCTSFGTDDVLIQRCLDDSVLKIPLLVTNEAIFKAHYSQGDNFSFSVQSPQFEVNQTQCNTTTHLCILFRNSVNSTYTEVYLSNNIACQSVATYCDIFSDISLDAMTVIPGLKFNPWIPEYRHNETIEFLVRNSGGSRIDPVVSSSINFSPYVTLHFTDDLGTVISIMESAKCADKDTQLGLQSGATMTMQCTVAFILKFDQCINSTHRNMTICADMINWVSPSFIDENLANNRRCIDAPKPFIREGGAYSKNFELRLYTPFEIEGVEIKINKSVLLTSEQFPLQLTVQNGTDVTYTVKMTDGTSQVIVHPEPVSYAQPINITHTFNAPGVYDIHVLASSPMNNESSTVSGIIVQNPIAAVAQSAYFHTATPTIYFPVTHTGAVPTNVSCKVNLAAGPEFSLLNQFQNVSASKSTETVTLECPPNLIAEEMTLSVRCWNLVSQYAKNSTVVCNEPVSGLTANASHVFVQPGQNLSITIRVSNGTSVELTTRFGDSTPNSVTFHPSKYASSNEIVLAHSYSTAGNYTVIVNASNPIKWKRVFPVVGVIPVFVFAFNNVSNDSAQTFATVIDIPCYKPRLRLFDLDASPLQVTSVLTKRRSEQVNLTAVAPYNCSKLTNISTYWTIIAVQSSIELPLCTDNSDQCLVQRRVLPYGLYNVSFTAELTVDAAMAETAWILLNVSKTPLSLEAITGPEYVSFNQTFVLNASATATDFDVEDGDLSGMTFQWSCFRPEESDSANTISIPSQTEARALSELRGCFGNGPGVVYLGNASIAGSLTVNSFDLVPNASYVFRVRLTKDTREVWQSKTVFVESQPKPVGRLDCEQNCGAKVVAKRPLVYRLVCEQNCGHKFFTVSSNLTIVRLGVSGYEIEGTRQSSSDGQELSISAGTLMESSYYRVMGQLWNLGQEISNLVANITVNGPPVVISRKTNVQLLCKNWTEFGAAVAPLLYESMLILPQSGKRYSLFSSTNAVSPRVMLPLGDSSWAVVQFVVSDSFGAQQYYNFTFS
uniref:TECT1 protein n=1 Tax=Macrostomum lignano TaxID=282301 RepID=A0A1I8GK20_9PLAT